MTHYFAAANGETGFRSLFPSLFSPRTHRRIYILKGGPGSGKSTLMKKIGFTAEAMGHETEYYLCSSDTSSLDAVRIPALGVVILDGTAPHVAEPQFPGAVERIVNLGEAFDNDALEKEREKIMALGEGKRESYRTAYRYLAAAGRMVHEQEALITPVFLSAKAEAAAVRLAASLKKAKRGRETVRLVSAIGTRGAVHLNTLREKAKKICAITEKHGAEYLFMDHLHGALAREGIEMTVCHTPLTEGRIEEIWIESESLLFAVMDEEAAERAEKLIHGARFVSREGVARCRGRLRFAEKCQKGLLEGALTSLEEAGRLHGELEKIYGQATDFAVIDHITDGLISEIFANNM